MNNQEYIDSLVANARKAQGIVETYTQAQVNAICRAIAKVIYDHAEPLARMAVDETRMGVYEHKVAKNKGKAKVIWNDMKYGKSVGVIEVDEAAGLIKVAKPMGVVAAITPTTNPIVTPMCNAMFAIKGRNAIIVCPHPRSQNCSGEAIALMNGEIKKLGGPDNLIQVVEKPTNELSAMLMKACDVVLATGGMGVVKAAYSSGKPSFGVGAGNVQSIFDADIDYAKHVEMLIQSRIFDNGIICSGEQSAIMPASKYDEIVAAFVNAGTYYTDKPTEVRALRDAIFPGGIMNKDLVGRPVAEVAAAAGIQIPENTRMILVKADTYGRADMFSKEKMCPVVSAYAYSDWDEAIAVAKANLLFEGAGHSVCLHSDNREHIIAAAQVLPVSRFLVNQICATTNGGSLTNSLNATTTLGCGSWGNNSLSENLSWRHLFNVSRIAWERPGATVPTDEEIWG